MSMKQLLAGSLLGAGLAALAIGTALAAPEVNRPAPAFPGTASDGSTVTLAGLRGKTVVLEWTNHDCPFVRKHYGSGNMQALQKAAAAKGIVWLQVISSAPGEQGHVDGPTAIRLNTERDAAPSNTLIDVDGTIGKAYDARTTPHMFIIDSEGTLVYMGGIDSIRSSRQSDVPKAVNYVHEALQAMEKGASVPNPVTRPYGCSVKYAL